METTLYESVVELLGKPREHPACESFFQGNEHVVLHCGPQITQYNFSELGVGLTYEESAQLFNPSIFYLRGHPDGIKSYVGNLPNNIELSDSRDTVERKLGIKPSYSNLHPSEPGQPDNRYEIFIVGSFEIHFEFSGTGHLLIMVSTAKKLEIDPLAEISKIRSQLNYP